MNYLSNEPIHNYLVFFILKINALGNESGVIKEGFLLKGPEAGTDSFISLATKVIEFVLDKY